MYTRGARSYSFDLGTVLLLSLPPSRSHSLSLSLPLLYGQRHAYVSSRPDVGLNRSLLPSSSLCSILSFSLSSSSSLQEPKPEVVNKPEQLRSLLIVPRGHAARADYAISSYSG